MDTSMQDRTDRDELYYVFRHAPGPNWESGKPIWEQPGFQGHVDHLTRYFDRRQGILGGPFQDGSGGLVVLEFANVESAKAAAHADPAVLSGVLVVEVIPWLVVKSGDTRN